MKRQTLTPARFLSCLLAIAACSQPTPGPGSEQAAGAKSAAAAGAKSAAAAGADGPIVLFLGDSITAGLGVAEADAFPAVIGRRLRDRGAPIRPVNAGVSGDTTAGGLSRLPWLLRHEPDVVVVELGANDALRGQPLEGIEENLREIVRLSRDAGAAVLLLSMRIPPNYGPDYAEGFVALYERIALEDGVTLVPHFLDGVGGRSSMNQPDGIHPTSAGHERLADNIEDPLAGLVARAAGR